MQKLYIGKQFTGVTVQQDSNYPTMWRVHMGESKSDILELNRAKDAALTWARLAGFRDDHSEWRTSYETRNS